ncbi:MAG: Ferredoxin [Syntrophaceae bacterium PtaU1.Bin231]|nr:MAG: Ferredoxin [Syntrophaceae bacterium PtaU1.Bin231]
MDARRRIPDGWTGRCILAAIVNEALCNGCGACAEVCPAEAVEIVDGKARVDAETCIECGVCEMDCTEDAISLA